MALLHSVATNVQLPIAAGNVWESTGTGLFYWFAVFKSVFQKCVCQNSLKRTSSLPFYIDIDFFFLPFSPYEAKSQKYTTTWSRGGI